MSGVDQDARNMALLCHILGFFLSFLGPLVLWLLKKDTSSFVDEHGKEALNFQINIAFWLFVFSLLTVVLIGLPFLFLTFIADFVLAIVAAMKAYNGERYAYPAIIRLVQ